MVPADLQGTAEPCTCAWLPGSVKKQLSTKWILSMFSAQWVLSWFSAWKKIAGFLTGCKELVKDKDDLTAGLRENDFSGCQPTWVLQLIQLVSHFSEGEGAALAGGTKGRASSIDPV